MLEFSVKNQIIERIDNFHVVADSKNYLSAKFSFSEEWTGEIRAVFGNDGKFYDVSVEDNSCMVPWEAIKPPFFTVSLFCGEESLVTANVLTIEVEKSGMAEGEVPSTPTPTVWQQYIASMQEIIDSGLPYIGENGNWFLYNAEECTYKDTGTSATGPKGEQGIRGEKGEKGDTGKSTMISGASAIVHPTTGAPSVKVYPQGTAEKITFAFEFDGLKGEKGEKGDTAGYNAGEGIDITDETISVKGFTLISDITLEEDAESVKWTKDDAGNPLNNYKDFLIYFSGKFTANTTTAEPLLCRGNNGNCYFMYKSFNKSAEKHKGFWIEMEEVCRNDNMTVFKSTYPQSLLGNYSTDSILTQGLTDNNTALYSDFCVRTDNVELANLSFDCTGTATSIFAAGSRFLLFGRER